MEAAIAHAAAPSEATTPAAFEDDSRHFAITASQVPKPAAVPPSANILLEANVKDMKSIGTRFHEDCHETDLSSPRLRSSRMFKGKGKEAVPLQQERKKPLRLLDLPVDILKDVVKEVTHTNDLTSLALCHSALHALTTPHIYSRFDIVWPDSSTHAEPRSGVDALTYGLATLVMAEEVFGEAPGQQAFAQQQRQSNRFVLSGYGKASDISIRRRRGNHYAHFTKKFSLGNGPVDWVQEYLISKEGGKMLGTLVALAVARMQSLETFIWDMPTGILRDVWLALSSLGDRSDGRPCRLERLWVRWHDNSSAESSDPPPPPPPLISTVIGQGQANSSHAAAAISPVNYNQALDRLERPTFSVLPPLKSLSVLDIDELAYLDEMAMLIGRSIDKLRELRVGIARHAESYDWVTVWEGDNLQQVDEDWPTVASLTIGEKRLGGVLGILSGFVHDLRKPKISLTDRTRQRSPSPRARKHTPAVAPTAFLSMVSDVAPGPARDTLPVDDAMPEQINEDLINFASTSGMTSLMNFLPEIVTSDLAQRWDGEAENVVPDWQPMEPERRSSGSIVEDNATVAAVVPEHSYVQDPPLSDASTPSLRMPALDQPPQSAEPAAVETLKEPSQADVSSRLDRVLRLDNLELERVPLSVPVLQTAIDWSKLTNLTILHCRNHEQLWKTLRRTFAPQPKSPTYPQNRHTPSQPSSKKSRQPSLKGEMQYSLNLKKIHTNTVSPSLISFLKETLAPNSLEVLLLQEARTYTSTVSINAIYRGPLKRHKGSLKKLLIDSSEKGVDGLPSPTLRWRRWMLNREILSFITSGKMAALRELGMAIDYRDWHYFLQRLPSISHLRSIYIPFVADHVHNTSSDPRELALQIVDIVALRPEVELCYMGIATKCFEILENRRDFPDSQLNIDGSHMEDGGDSDADDDDDEDAEGAEDEDEADAAEAEAEAEEAAAEETESNSSDEDSDDDDDELESNEGKNTARLRLREILFYDDKVAIFKARHGRL